MEVPSTTGNPPVINPQVNQPTDSAVPTSQAPAVQITPPPNQNVSQSPPVSQPQSPVKAVTSEPKKSKFKLFLIISIILIVIIWGAVAYIYFNNQNF